MKAPKVVIVLEGGLVVDVLSTVPVDYAVVDYDTDGADDEDIIQMPQTGKLVEPCTGHTAGATLTPKRAKEMFAAIAEAK